MDLTVLNKKQYEAVTAPMGPVLVLAGAGSGKTRVLTYRIAYLIERGLVPAVNILAVTFTNKAAKEMQERVEVLKRESGVVNSLGRPMLGTFHSIGARILRKEISQLGYSPSFVIADSDDQLKIIKDILKDLDVPKQYGPQLFRSYISSAKNLLQTPKELQIGLDGYLFELVQQVYIRYQDFLFKQNTLDFDDLLMLPIKLFQALPQVLRKYQESWQYILVDEYQDTNQAQYMFLHMLAKHQNLFVVGDDAQSIYGFRGSNIANILNFEKDFSDALVVKLEQNYRSSKNILAAAQKVIELNTEQKPKTLWTENDSGNPVNIEEVFDGREEALFVARKIVKLASLEAEEEIEYEEDYDQEPVQFSILDKYLSRHQRGGLRNSSHNVPQLPQEHESLKEFAVLYRTHAQSREIEEVFIEAGIPYQIVGGLKFYERKEIKDVLAYLRLVLNHYDITSLKRVINLPPRGVGDKSFALLKELILQQPKEQSLSEFLEILPISEIPAKARLGIEQFYSTIRSLSGLSAEATLTDLLKQTIKLSQMETYLKDGTEVGDMRVENVRELFNVTAKFDDKTWTESLVQFLEEVALVTSADENSDKDNSVTVMTLHAAKGLEFDTVFFVGLEEGILPHSQSMLNPK